MRHHLTCLVAVLCWLGALGIGNVVPAGPAASVPKKMGSAGAGGAAPSENAAADLVRRVSTTEERLAIKLSFTFILFCYHYYAYCICLLEAF
jgi:hypothetical protein